MLSSAFCHLSVGDRRGSNTGDPESTAREIRSGGEALRNGADVRSILFAEQKAIRALLDRPGEAPRELELDADSSLHLLKQSISAARDAGLPWGARSS